MFEIVINRITPSSLGSSEPQVLAVPKSIQGVTWGTTGTSYPGTATEPSKAAFGILAPKFLLISLGKAKPDPPSQLRLLGDWKGHLANCERVCLSPPEPLERRLMGRGGGWIPDSRSWGFRGEFGRQEEDLEVLPALSSGMLL